MRCWVICPTPSDAPGSASPPPGSHRNATANTYSAPSPSQNTGAASSAYDVAVMARSSQPPWRQAAVVPKTMPSSSAPAKATISNSTDQPSRWPMTWETG